MVASLSPIDGPLVQERAPGPTPPLRVIPLPMRTLSPDQSADGQPAGEDPVAVQISDEARSAINDAQQEAATLQAFAAALQQGMVGFSREAARVFTLLGLSPGNAGQAVAAVSSAIREATGSPSFRGKILAFNASGNIAADGSYRASLVLEKAALAWDPATSAFVATVRRMALLVGFDARPTVTPRGVPQPAEIPPGTKPFIRIDASIPLSGLPPATAEATAARR